jgi:hypothetical protein
LGVARRLEAANVTARCHIRGKGKWEVSPRKPSRTCVCVCVSVCVCACA